VVAAFLTGSFAPITFYPAAVQSFIAWTPFPYFLYYPVEVLTGAAGLWESVRIIAIQCVWVGIMLLVRSVLWRRGLRRYGAVGA
jgi:ABC-2 type transport system permease protein